MQGISIPLLLLEISNYAEVTSAVVQMPAFCAKLQILLPVIKLSVLTLFHCWFI